MDVKTSAQSIQSGQPLNVVFSEISHYCVDFKKAPCGKHKYCRLHACWFPAWNAMLFSFFFFLLFLPRHLSNHLNQKDYAGQLSSPAKICMAVQPVLTTSIIQPGQEKCK